MKGLSGPDAQQVGLLLCPIPQSLLRVNCVMPCGLINPMGSGPCQNELQAREGWCGSLLSSLLAHCVPVSNTRLSGWLNPCLLGRNGTMLKGRKKSSWGDWVAPEDATWEFHIHPQGKGRSWGMKGYFMKTFPRDQRVWGLGTVSSAVKLGPHPGLPHPHPHAPDSGRRVVISPPQPSLLPEDSCWTAPDPGISGSRSKALGAPAPHVAPGEENIQNVGAPVLSGHTTRGLSLQSEHPPPPCPRHSLPEPP